MNEQEKQAEIRKLSGIKDADEKRIAFSSFGNYTMAKEVVDAAVSLARKPGISVQQAIEYLNRARQSIQSCRTLIPERSSDYQENYHDLIQLLESEERKKRRALAAQLLL